MHEALMKCEDKMTKTLAKLDDDLGAIRAGRANPHVLDHIRVNYYGTPTPIQQTANVYVSQMRSWLPDYIGGVVWWGNDDPPEWCPWCGAKVVCA